MEDVVSSSNDFDVDGVLSQDGSFKKTLGFSDDDLEVLYNIAYTRYQQGQYEGAEEVLGLLCIYDHRSEKFWKGLGATRQILKDFEGAALAYSMAAQTGSSDPMIPLHAAECYCALGMLEEAVAGLESALALAEDIEESATIKFRIEAIAETLEKNLAEADDTE
jgi:type III secretion system low calcium response chaperone LcrH/SycD